MLTLPNWWWRILCVVQVISFVMFVEFIVLNFPSGIQKAIHRNTIRLDGSVSEKRVTIENAAIRNFKIQFLFQAGCVMVAVNMICLIVWLTNPMWKNLQSSFEESSYHPEAGSGLMFQPEFRFAIAAVIGLFLVFVVGGAVYFHLLAKLRAGIAGRSAGYRQFDAEKLERDSRSLKQ